MNTHTADRHSRLLLLAAMLLSCSAAAAPAPVPAPLAADGKALMPVVAGTNASDRTRAAATSLASYLSRMSGASFAVRDIDTAKGLFVGQPSDFAKIPFEVTFAPGPMQREVYVLKSAKDALWLLGATELAVEHATWDLLYRLGYRQFFPGDTWEVVPQHDELSIAVDVRESPDFYARRIWYNWGLWGYNNKPYAAWCARNRSVKGFDLNSGHAYGGIIRANRKTFDAHPEYGAMVGGRRKLSKFCVSNPDLRELVVEHAKRAVTKRPALDSISMDPSDGAGWCECVECEEMGSVSDRALTLANAVAAAINELGLGDKYVGMYAYNMHSAPPSIPVHSNVIISATTAFIRGGFTFDQIVEGWQAQGATMEVYDYFSVIAWDWNKPRGARAARPAVLATNIRKYHDQGARFLDAESGDAWGPYGLGYYVASRVMWDVEQADHVEEIVDDFLSRAFGPAKAPMEEFYDLITVDTTLRSSADILGRMYRHLAAARELALDDLAVRKRLDDLILYTRYAELHENFATATGNAKEAAKTRVLHHSFRMRRTMMVHTYGIWARLASQRDANNKDHPARTTEAPFTEEEIQDILKNGIANNATVEIAFETIDFSEELVPAAEALQLPRVEPGKYPPSPQDTQTYYIWVDEAPAEIKLNVTVRHRWNLRPHRIDLFSPQAVDIKAVDTSDICKPDAKPRAVVLKSPYDGLHRLRTTDGGDYTYITWPDGMRVTVPSSMDTPGVKNHFRGAWTLYFYVPKGTKVVAGWASRIANWSPPVSGTVVDPDGKSVYDFGVEKAGWFSVPVGAGQDGKLWKFANSHGDRRLMTVPSYFARTAEDLLLPREVVERDAR